jgi:hypothetical protein
MTLPPPDFQQVFFQNITPRARRPGFTMDFGAMRLSSEGEDLSIGALTHIGIGGNTYFV